MASAGDLAFLLYSALSTRIYSVVVVMVYTIIGNTCTTVNCGRRDEVTSIAMNICHLSTVEFECDELLDGIKATKKDTALRLALSRLASDFGRESMLSLQRFFSSRHAPVISTGSLKGQFT
ncbi:DNA repair protein recA homolog 2, mitochondrial-like isoform X2 [Castanea sativa]|uniref:DNA repair protein recA homolog 2, mitochondrial-like isoform X2 n=1 Tax=Castanea sativa TaxID=21020 RepID=UPI003F653735